MIKAIAVAVTFTAISAYASDNVQLTEREINYLKGIAANTAISNDYKEVSAKLTELPAIYKNAPRKSTVISVTYHGNDVDPPSEYYKIPRNIARWTVNYKETLDPIKVILDDAIEKSQQYQQQNFYANYTPYDGNSYTPFIASFVLPKPYTVAVERLRANIGKPGFSEKAQQFLNVCGYRCEALNSVFKGTFRTSINEVALLNSLLDAYEDGGILLEPIEIARSVKTSTPIADNYSF